MTTQPTALRLADALEQRNYPTEHSPECAAAAELRRLHAENATLQQGYDAARMEIDHLRGATKMAAPAGEYPALPEHAALIMRGKPLHRYWIRHVDTPVFTADQMRAYADATCAMRAQAAPAAAAGPSDESAAYQQWFQGEQGKPYQGMWEFARAAWMARAAAPTTQAAPVAQGDALDVEIAALESSCAHLGRLIDELRPDAERYQYLRERDLDTIRQGGVFAGRTPDNVVLNGDDLDAAIDAARSAKEGASHD